MRLGTAACALVLALGCSHAHAPTPTSVRLWLGGDVNLGAGAGAPLAPLQPLVAGRGAGIVNLEGPVAAAQPAGPGLKLFNAPSALVELGPLGVRVAGIANNHAGDTGASGPAQTAAAVREAGLLPAGLVAGPAHFVVDGVRIAVTAHDLSGGVPAHLADELARAHAEADVLVATFHVTGPPSYLPRPELREAVEIALGQGARIVAAHGTHALGPIERRGKAVIAWGLGNVAFACDCTDQTDAVLIAVELRADATEVAVLPIDAGLRGAPARPASDPAGIFDLLEGLGTPLERHGSWAALAPEVPER